jgi:hypothetical protein
VRIFSTLILSAILLSLGTADAGPTKDQPKRATVVPCETRYNAVITQARQALARRDRATTMELLERAKKILARCVDEQPQSEPSDPESTAFDPKSVSPSIESLQIPPASAAALNSNAAGASILTAIR